MYRVKVYKQDFDFSAGHFITYGGRCETLHGHNYHVEVTLEGENGPDGFVYNFSDLKPIVRDECSRLDHRVILAQDNRHLHFEIGPHEVEVRFEQRRYVFPAEEVVLLPLANTTAELLATYLCDHIRTRLQAQNRPEYANLTRIEVSVEEQPGQAACYSFEL